jgi:hypothetical protein
MPIRCVAGFEKSSARPVARFQLTEVMRARRGIAARYIKANSSRKDSRQSLEKAFYTHARS